MVVVALNTSAVHNQGSKHFVVMNSAQKQVGGSFAYSHFTNEKTKAEGKKAQHLL